MYPGVRITEILLYPPQFGTTEREFIITYDDGTFLRGDTKWYRGRDGTPAHDLKLVAFCHGYLNIETEDVEVLACDAGLWRRS